MQKTLEIEMDAKYKEELIMYHGTGGMDPRGVLKEEKQLDVWYANTDPK